MPEPLDKKLYERVKKKADQKFESKKGIYRSSWIVKEYKKLGGKYNGRKSKNSGLKRWFREEWVDINRPKRNSKGKIIGYEKCGRDTKEKNSKYPLCRPTRKVTSKTPRIYKDIKKYSIRKANVEKQIYKHTKNVQFGGTTNNPHELGEVCVLLCSLMFVWWNN
jgi:hypothetical protein